MAMIKVRVKGFMGEKRNVQKHSTVVKINSINQINTQNVRLHSNEVKVTKTGLSTCFDARGKGGRDNNH